MMKILKRYLRIYLVIFFIMGIFGCEQDAAELINTGNSGGGDLNGGIIIGGIPTGGMMGGG